MAEIEMVPVRSSNLASAGFDEEAQTMRIEFVTGSAYDYAGVSRATYDALLAAPSAGEFFARNIRNRFSFTKVA
jgi:hypothetical protein